MAGVGRERKGRSGWAPSAEPSPTWRQRHFNRFEKAGSKAFFFEKKKQKTFIHLAKCPVTAAYPMSKSFLVLFFKKEHLSSVAPSI
jgi:hypothetical protein